MRRSRAVRTSCRAAARGEVTIPRQRGNPGRARFFPGSNRPSASSLALSLRNASYSLPAPARRIASAPSWNSPRASYSEGRARISTWSPLAGMKSAYWFRPRNITQRTWAFASLREKYQCPEAAAVKLETSPSTHSKGRADSRARRAIRFSSLTVRTGGSSRTGSTSFSALSMEEGYPLNAQSTNFHTVYTVNLLTIA